MRTPIYFVLTLLIALASCQPATDNSSAPEVEAENLEVDTSRKALAYENPIPEKESGSEDVDQLPAKYISPKIPEKVNFAGERIPLEDPEVRERFDRELIVNCYRHSATIRYIKLANRWFPVIEPILKRNGVPDDFKYLAVAESGLDNVVSPAGARGFWQFMKAAGKSYDLEINKEVDERYHVEKATQAACDYLKNGKRRFGKWTLAAAGYNMGNGGLSKRLKDQMVEDYFDLYLNNETSRYVLRLAALKTVMKDPEGYGFFMEPRDLYQPIKTTTLVVDTTVKNLNAFAKEVGTNYKTIRYLNPWLRSTKLPNNSGKKYEIKIPR